MSTEYAFETPVTIEHIYISPGHNYFGRPKSDANEYPTHVVEMVEAKAGLGLKGDRYFAVPAHYKAQATLIAAEVLDEVQEALALDALDPVLTRRNIVIRGVPLNQLIGVAFLLDYGTDSVLLEGASHCAPCGWMDAQIGEGARTAMRGRGGLRVRILADGVIRQGAALLRTNVMLDSAGITAPLALPRLP